MDVKNISVLLLAVVCFSVFGICCSGAASTAPSSPDTSSTPAPSKSEAPQVNIPTVDKTKLPVIQFTVSPNMVSPGGTAVLSWNVTNATSITIDHGIGAVSATGTKNITLTAPATYKLTAANEIGSAIKTVSIAITQGGTPPATTKPSSK